MNRQFNISVEVCHGTVICGSVGGNVRLNHGDKITWTIRGNKKIQLEFFLLGREDEVRASSELRRWPFSGSEPDNFSVGPVQEFTGTIAPEAAGLAFKYYVTVLPDLLRLDPIIIVH